MARQVHSLTAINVMKANKPGMHGDGGGLYLRVSRRGTKSWIFRYRQNGRLRDMGLGSANLVSLAEARTAAHEHAKATLAYRQGAAALDPIGKRREAQAAQRIEVAKGMT